MAQTFTAKHTVKKYGTRSGFYSENDAKVYVKHHICKKCQSKADGGIDVLETGCGSKWQVMENE